MDPHQQISAPNMIVETVANSLTSNSTVLDLACGGGRNGRHLLAMGHRVTFLDRDINGVADLAGAANTEIIKADLEDGREWPLGQRQFDLVIVANYLWRPISRHIFNSVKIGGTIAYETFAVGNEAYGRPSNPKFLLAENELISLTHGQFSISHFSSGEIGKPTTAVKQNLIAKRRPASFEKEIGDLIISDDPLRLDMTLIHDFLTNSYWVMGIQKDRLENSINDSLSVGLYGSDGQQIGYAGFVTNNCSFSYVRDVFVLPEFRGLGYGKIIVEALLSHPSQQKVRRLLLITRDAFELYEKFGFKRLENTNVMERLNPNWLE